MATVPQSQTQPQSFNVDVYKKKIHDSDIELEKFLVEELPEESDLLNSLFQIRDKFKQVLEKISKTEKESERREDMHGLINIFTQLKASDMKSKFKIYTPERISRFYQVNNTLNKMLEALDKRTFVLPIGDATTGDSALPKQDKPLEVTVPPPVVVAFPDNLEECRWSSRYAPKPHGLTERIKFMESLMVKKTKEDGMFGAIAIIGIPGVGKTALCQVMLVNEKVKKHYSFQLWVCLSKQKEEIVEEEKEKEKQKEKEKENQTPEKERVVIPEVSKRRRKVEILKRMLICLGHDDDVVEAIIGDTGDVGNIPESIFAIRIHELIFAIRRQLKGKKYLVVLDDAADDDLHFLENLSDPTPKSPEGKYVYETMADVFPRDPGGMVVVTTRLEKIAEQIVGEKNVHNLPLLKNKDDCWQIFKDTVAQDGKKFPDEHSDLKELITSKCASVPLAAKMMGVIMYKQLKERENKKQEKALGAQSQATQIS